VCGKLLVIFSYIYFIILGSTRYSLGELITQTVRIASVCVSVSTCNTASLCPAVTICDTLVNRQTHTQGSDILYD